MFIRLGAELSNPEREIIMSKSTQTLQTFCAYPAPTHPLLVFPLLGHLVAEVGQLRGQLLHQLLRLIQLEIFLGKIISRDSEVTTHLALQSLPLVLFPVHILHCQRDGSQSGKPVQTPVLGGSNKLREKLNFLSFNLRLGL